MINGSNQPGFFKKVVSKMFRKKKNTVNTGLVPVNTMQEGLMSRLHLKFTIHFASGGKIVEVTKWDEANEENKLFLYIIKDEDNFGEEIEKIITMTGLR